MFSYQSLVRKYYQSILVRFLQSTAIFFALIYYHQYFISSDFLKYSISVSVSMLFPQLFITSLIIYWVNEGAQWQSGDSRNFIILKWCLQVTLVLFFVALLLTYIYTTDLIFSSLLALLISSSCLYQSGLGKCQHSAEPRNISHFHASFAISFTFFAILFQLCVAGIAGALLAMSCANIFAFISAFFPRESRQIAFNHVTEKQTLKFVEVIQYSTAPVILALIGSGLLVLDKLIFIIFPQKITGANNLVLIKDILAGSVIILLSMIYNATQKNVAIEVSEDKLPSIIWRFNISIGVLLLSNIFCYLVLLTMSKSQHFKLDINYDTVSWVVAYLWISATFSLLIRFFEAAKVSKFIYRQLSFFLAVICVVLFLYLTYFEGLTALYFGVCWINIAAVFWLCFRLKKTWPIVIKSVLVSLFVFFMNAHIFRLLA